jgi:hypothetical protein
MPLRTNAEGEVKRQFTNKKDEIPPSLKPCNGPCCCVGMDLPIARMTRRVVFQYLLN